jgi:hypothetical protein
LRGGLQFAWLNGMRIVLVLSALSVALGACSQSLTGNVSGAGGSATGGGNRGGAMSGGAGAGGSDIAALCSNLAAEYQVAVAQAQSCDVGQAGQCQQAVPGALSLCGSCPTYVNDASGPKMLQEAWLQAGCTNLPAPPCLGEGLCLPVNNVCVQVLDTNHGTCVEYAPPGTGGTSGAGGTSGTGPGPGTGGSSPDGGLSVCDGLAQKYAAALPAAKSCAAGGPAPCQISVAAGLGCFSGCSVYVNDATELNAISQQWQAAGCADAPMVCLAIGCLPAVGGMCAQTDGGGPTCVTSYAGFQ